MYQTENIQWFDVEYGIYLIMIVSKGYFFYIFTSTKHDTKYKQILSNAGDKFHIQSQNIEFSLVIEKC